MKIDFCTPLLDLNGEQVEIEVSKGVKKKLTIADRVSVALGRDASSPDPAKFVTWAIKMTAGEVVDMDKSDQKKFLEWVDNNGGERQMPFFSAIDQFRIGQLIEDTEKVKKDK